MRIAFFDANDWTIKAFSAPAPEGESDWHQEYSLTFFQQKLDSSSVNLAVNFDVTFPPTQIAVPPPIKY